MKITDQALKSYRALNPASRALRRWTYYGSGGSVRRVTCVACRRVIATSAQNWPETKTARRDRDQHLATCEDWALLDRAATA